jgi:hypothetical protein
MNRPASENAIDRFTDLIEIQKAIAEPEDSARASVTFISGLHQI